MEKKVNIAMQILPQSTKVDSYKIIDEAIEVIKNSGIKYQVCPFETVMEGSYDEILDIAKKAQEKCFEKGAEELIVNFKIQRRKDRDVTIEDKIAKYKY